MKRSDKNTTPVEDSDIRVDGTPMPGVAARIGISPSSNDTGRVDSTNPGSEQFLMDRVRRSSASAAVGARFGRYAPWLRRRTSGHLPQWTRNGGVATSGSGAGRKGLGDNGIWRIRKLNGILYLPDVGSKTTSFSSACAGIFASN